MIIKHLQRLYLLLPLLLYFNKSNGQNHNNFDRHIDSLITISQQYYGKSLDSALFHANRVIRISKQQKSEVNVTKGLRLKAIILIMKGNYKTADSILKNNFKRPIDSLTLGINYQTLGNLYEYQSKYDLAIKNYLEAIKIYELDHVNASVNAPINLHRANISVATVNARIKRYDFAINYLKKALINAEKNNFPKSELMTNLAGIYYIGKKDYNKFIELSHKTIKQAKKEKLYHVEGYIYTNLCELYNSVDSLKDPQKALKYGKLALEKRLKAGAGANLSNTYSQIAKSYYNLNDLQKAIYYSNKAYPTASPEIKPEILSLLIDSYKKTGNYKLALKLSERYSNLKDSINKTLQEQKVTTITEKYESEKKQQQIDNLSIEKKLQEAQLTNQFYLFAGFIGLVAILGIILYFRYRNQKIKQQLNNQNLQHKLLQTQLNPHFLFHSLNAIQSYIFQNKKEEASSYLVSYSKLMRNILESSDEDFTTVKEDSNSISAFLKLQQLNVAEDTVLEISIDDTIEDYKIPPMFIQPYVENAIIHGISSIPKGHVKVTYSEDKNTILVTITDNGTGFKDNKGNNKMHRSMSSKILNERINLFEKKYNYSIKTNIQTNEFGTIVNLNFPKRK